MVYTIPMTPNISCQKSYQNYVWKWRVRRLPFPYSIPYSWAILLIRRVSYFGQKTWVNNIFSWPRPRVWIWKFGEVYSNVRSNLLRVETKNPLLLTSCNCNSCVETVHKNLANFYAWILKLGCGLDAAMVTCGVMTWNDGFTVACLYGRFWWVYLCSMEWILKLVVLWWVYFGWGAPLGQRRRKLVPGVIEQSRRDSSNQWIRRNGLCSF